MMRFFARTFSTKVGRLLIFAVVGCGPSCGEGATSLTMNQLEKDKPMVKSRSEVPVEDRWNVEALYPTPEAWKEDFEQAKGQEGQEVRWPELVAYKGRLGSPKDLASFAELYLGVDRKLTKLHVYAHLRLDEDLGNDHAKNHYGMISHLANDFQCECAWIEPELLALSQKDFDRLLAHPEIQPYCFYLERIGRMRPHTLSKEQEELLALTGKALDTSRRAFSSLNNADMTFDPAVDAKGEEHPLTIGSYAAYMRSSDRTLRASAFKNIMQGYGNYINTLCELLQGHVEGHLFSAKARHFNSCLEAALFPNQVDVVVYENLIASVRRNLGLMHEYVALRKQLMQLDEIHPYDMSVSLVPETEIQMSYEEARRTVIASVAPLGKDYQEKLTQGLVTERWVDVYENARKRSGAYSSGCYDSMPYILLNYQGTFHDIFTLAHEAGHSMHSLLSRLHQPYLYSSYPIFVAEVASTFNEQLLMDHFKAQTKDKKKLAYLINHQIDGIRNTLFRQVLFAEFELKIHRLVEEGTPLTPGMLKKTYLDLYRDYHGPELILDEEVAFEWARIPHFYSSFYVYQYATGISAALALHEKVLRSPEATKRYLNFLSSGGSGYPIDLLQKAGVDMRTADPKTSPVEAAMRHFAALIEELKKCML